MPRSSHRENDVTNDVQSRIFAGLADAVPNVTCVAQDLGLSVRTLQRRLHAQRLNFSTLLDDERARVSLRELTNGCVLPPNWYRRVGYAHPTIFKRALRRWQNEKYDGKGAKG